MDFTCKIEEALSKSDSSKITRSAFLYLEPKQDNKDFAQCKTCTMFTGSTCTILGKDISVKASDSCGMYVPGENTNKTDRKLLTPEEVGFVKHQVRCENCVAFNAEESTCELFKMLNKFDSEKFDLTEKVKAQGCCNAQTPK